MTNQGRFIKDYEIINAFPIGEKEVVIGVHSKPFQLGEEKMFICAVGKANDIIERYIEVFTSNDYFEMVDLFTKRISEEANKMKEEVLTEQVPFELFSKDKCLTCDENTDLKLKVIAVNPISLRPEYERITNQLYLVTGGEGALANSKTSRIFGRNLYSGDRVELSRKDVLGEVRQCDLPFWAKVNLNLILNALKYHNKLENEVNR